MAVGAGGRMLERSIVDRSVGLPERLVFEGAPVLVAPLKQDKHARKPTAVSGRVIDTATACPPLTILESSKLEQLKMKEVQRLAPEAHKVRSAFIEGRAKELAQRTGKSVAEARKAIERQCEGMLRPDMVLPFDDPELAGCTVADVLADPDRFVYETLADPLEGIEYGRCKAKIFRRSDGTLWINSFAHGGMRYELRRDAAAVRSAMLAAAKGDVVKTFVTLCGEADLDPQEMAELRQLAKKLSGVVLSAIDDALAAAQQQQTAQRAKEERGRRFAARRDPRPHIRAPGADNPWIPEMGVLNGVIGKVAAARPPTRDIDGVVTRAHKIPVPNTHAFTQAEANTEEDAG